VKVLTDPGLVVAHVVTPRPRRRWRRRRPRRRAAEGEAPAEPEVIKKGKAEAAERARRSPSAARRARRARRRKRSSRPLPCASWWAWATRGTATAGPGTTWGSWWRTRWPRARGSAVGRGGRRLDREARVGRRGRAPRQARYLHEPQRRGVERVLEARGGGSADLVVVLDDVALDLGTLRVRERGTHGGHNGLRSLIEVLGSDEFARVRVGYGRASRRRTWRSTSCRSFPRTTCSWSRRWWAWRGRGRVPRPPGRRGGHEPFQRWPQGARLARGDGKT
jgi:hypothetical protein